MSDFDKQKTSKPYSFSPISFHVNQIKQTYIEKFLNILDGVSIPRGLEILSAVSLFSFASCMASQFGILDQISRGKVKSG